MIDSNLYRNFLKQRLGAKDCSGLREVVTKCRYCDDSHAHMYLNIPMSENDIPYHYCQRCRTRGVVTYKKLMEWGVYDDDIALQLINHMKSVKLTSYNRKYFDREVYILYNNYINNDDLSLKKLSYINNRLGTNLTFEDCKRMKIMLNLNDLISSNHIDRITRDQSIINQLDKYFLGFISLDNAFVNMRKICKDGLLYPSIDKRYINYSIFGKFDNSEKFYTVPKNIDLTTGRRIALNIAEGPFDILSVYYNLRNQSDDIYTCIGGNNYIGTIRKFITGMRLPYLELHIYPDNDKFGDDKAIRNIIQYCAPYGCPIYVHRNVKPGQKDFGVSPDKIDERIERVL